MRKIRVLSVIIFALSVGVFVYFKIWDKKSADTNGPDIQMAEESIEVSSEAGSGEMLAGVTAVDAKDGDVSASLVIESMANFTERGRRTITFAAFDSDNNVTKATREIIYSDYTPPAFSLAEPLYFPLNADSFTDALTVSDVLDGDLTQNIKISAENEVKVNTEGDYPVVFSVANSAGDTVQLPVTVTIYNPAEWQTYPSISLSQYLIHIQAGENVDPWSYVDEVSYRGTVYRPETDSQGRWILAEEDSEDAGSFDEPGSGEDSPYEDQGASDFSSEDRKYLTDIEITNPVDSSTPGTYEITYRVTAGEDQDQKTGTMRLIVVVDEQGV